ncbi:hypothetical protein MIND_00006000 [Mycena indigotica]|uniref:Uncharacterized protein n=1 Tax=Mycena indigotica TaxID=2126181 RepID=A0A8H6TDU6_9AGAR|nr:uncharacterized protein MIND_00006000 [Mycena indigotica]KAF7314921.1 hypothetical protein MIND_00006000 [Mycena indigotica]
MGLRPEAEEPEEILVENLTEPRVVPPFLSRFKTTIVDMGSVPNYDLDLRGNAGDQSFLRVVPKVLSAVSGTLEYLLIGLPSEEWSPEQPPLPYPSDIQTLPESLPRLRHLQVSFVY